ncbi:Bardet-Biedl syndrome 12 protein-like protein [Trichoplax sp. H2]|nr:Bardet-Biedl syndrome 12 protein-like protein [Trichoplax sp. H2]|eukprot:RDD42821.1 Bardet-Biedl syndrome 12 protein-like protein [Trichoplax sp. H2]
MYKVKENTNSLMVLQTVAQSIKTLLGCNKSIKCFIDENDETAAKFLLTPLDFLQNVNILHPAIHVITESCNKHCKEYGTCSTTLLVIAGLLAKETECLNKQGIPIHVITKLFDEALAICIKKCEQVAINLSSMSSWSILAESHENESNLSPEESDENNLYVTRIINMQDKNDFSIFLKGTYDKIATMSETDSKIYTILSYLGQKLSRGDYSLTRLAIDALWKQYQNSSTNDLSTCRFYLATIDTIEILGPPVAESTLISGIVINCTSEAYSLCGKLNKKKLNIILLNGDITFQFRHIGYEDKYKEVTYITADQLSMERRTEQDRWLKNIADILHKNDIGLLAVKGYVDQRVVDLCHSNDIVLLSALSYNQLKALSLATGNVILTYIPDFNEVQIGLTVTVQQWVCGWNSKKTINKRTNKAVVSYHVLIQCEAPKTTLQMAVIHGSSRASLKSATQRFKSCLNRIYNVLHFGRCLPGGGYTELLCSEYLKNHKVIANGMDDDNKSVNNIWSYELSLYRSIVWTAFINVLDDYVATILLNDECGNKFETLNLVHKFKKQCIDISKTKNFLYSWPVLDDFTGKTAAWKQAVHIVKILAHSDYVIITDVK